MPANQLCLDQGARRLRAGLSTDLKKQIATGKGGGKAATRESISRRLD